MILAAEHKQDIPAAILPITSACCRHLAGRRKLGSADETSAARRWGAHSLCEG
jgi:hypothetical protein